MNTLTKNPWLIQLCKFRKNGNHKGTFDELFELNYMGSAEFEFGALPKSLKQLTKNVDTIFINRIKSITDYKSRMLVLVGDRDVTDEYSIYMKDLLEDKIRLKEGSRLKENYSGLMNNLSGDKSVSESSYYQWDVWWDIQNHVMFCFGVKTAEKLVRAIRNTRDKKKLLCDNMGWY